MHAIRSDLLFVSAVAGVIATIVQDLIGSVLIVFIPSYLNCVRIAAGILLPSEQVMVGGLLSTLLGFQIDAVVSIAIGVVTMLLLKYWGHDYYILKGVIVGAFSWVIFYVVLSRLLSQVYPTASALHAQLSFLNHLLFGVVLTWLIVRLRKGQKGLS